MFNSFIALIHAHPTISAIMIYIIFASAVDTMPAPKPTSSVGYLWAYSYLNVLSANVISRFGNKLPTIVTPTPTSTSSSVSSSIAGQGSQSK